MAEQTMTMTIPRTLPAGEIVAVDVSELDYMESFAEHHHEWVEGVVIKMSPITMRYEYIIDFCAFC
jgi:hypothetical protein